MNNLKYFKEFCNESILDTIFVSEKDNIVNDLISKIEVDFDINNLRYENGWFIFKYKNIVIKSKKEIILGVPSYELSVVGMIMNCSYFTKKRLWELLSKKWKENSK